MSITSLTAVEIAAKLRSKEVSAVEVTTAFLDRIDTEDSKYGAYLAVDRDRALAEAAAAQMRLETGDASLLTGVPVAIKDNMSTEGIETTCASKILKGYICITGQAHMLNGDLLETVLNAYKKISLKSLLVMNRFMLRVMLPFMLMVMSICK